MKTLFSKAPWVKLFGLGLVVFALSACEPIAVFSVNPTSPAAKEATTFDAAETMVSNVPEDTVATSFVWDFGDGKTGRGKSVDHTYANPGTYTVSLTVTDSAGRVGDTKQPVTVGKANPVSTTDPTAPVDPSTPTTPTTPTTPANPTTPADPATPADPNADIPLGEVPGSKAK